MNQYKRIFILGHPGAGKAVLAKALAEKLGWQFVNADFELEFRIGRTLDQILGEHGKEAFRHCESDILVSQTKKSNIVVTTDASIITHKKNQQLLMFEFVVYLKVSTPVQLDRLHRNQPQLLPKNDLKIFLDALHHERDHLYEQIANLTINSDDNALEKHVSDTIRVLMTEEEVEKLSDNVVLEKKELLFFHKSLHTPIQITEQQAKCIKLLAQGKTSKEIAKAMNISHRTVEDHLAKAMEQLGCSSSKELIALYYEK